MTGSDEIRLVLMTLQLVLMTITIVLMTLDQTGSGDIRSDWFW